MGDDFIGNMMKEGINQNINKNSQINQNATHAKMPPMSNPFGNNKPVAQPMGPLSPPKLDSNIDDIVKELVVVIKKSNKNKNKEVELH